VSQPGSARCGPEAPCMAFEDPGAALRPLVFSSGGHHARCALPGGAAALLIMRRSSCIRAVSACAVASCRHMPLAASLQLRMLQVTPLHMP
jgi:hypothetical protein